ncbi:hypothetical protein B0H21DRAFT_892064 [Amylocystis lapponica]|nr:hypothetical protein B0H21DRAFT_892064 [Amylocystis lapponica]
MYLLYNPRKYPPPDICLPSIDPPGTEVDVPPILQQKVFTRKDVELYKKAPALDTLPRTFVPCRKRKYKPPLMHYGWPALRLKMLKLAEDRQLTQMVSYMDFDHPDFHDGPGGPMTAPELDEVATIDFLVETTAKQITSKPPPNLEVVLALNAPNTCLVISLYTNYEPKSLSEDFIEKFRVALELEKPQWFLDDQYMVWTGSGPCEM